MPADLCSLTGIELLEKYRAREISPVEATRAVLERIERLNPLLNAFCLVDGEGALASARESEARWMKGSPLGLLDGVPVSIKDLILTRGWPTLLLRVWGGISLAGAIITVLPLPVLPFRPEQSIRHYGVHVSYAVTQLPVLSLMWRRRP